MNKKDVMLAKEYQLGMTIKNETLNPPIGWIMSEKFDGYRCLFCYELIDGKLTGVFYSRNNKRFNAPECFLETMPPYDLLKDTIIDGELWAGRDNFQLMGTVRKKNPNPDEWKNIQYQVYDITNIDQTFIERLKILKRIVEFTEKSNKLKQKKNKLLMNCPLIFAKQIKIKNESMMKEFYNEIINDGGEGIMIKHPKSKYKNGRSNEMLKYKPSFDREGQIIGYKLGDGKYKGLLGSLICRPLINHDTYMSIDEDDNHIFTLSGMDDEIRNNYKISHPVGTIINYECSGFTDKGVPRFGRYVRIRDDVIVKKHIQTNSKENLDKIIIVFNQLEKYYKSNYDMMRVKTYSQVNRSLRLLKDDTQLNKEYLLSIKGIGEGTIKKIFEIINTGKLEEYEKIKNKKSPLEEFLKIHGVGRQHAKKLYGEGFKSIDDLRKCETIKDYLNETQLKGLQYFDDIQQRIPYSEIQKHEIFLKDLLSKIDPEAELTIAGSYRRKSKDSGDIDLLLKSSNTKTYNKFIDTLTEVNYLTCQLARGNKKYMGMGKIDISPCHRRIDIMYTKPEEYPFAVLYFTGSGEFNVKMREYSLEKGYTMNEYSIKHTNNKQKVDKIFNLEKDIFDFLNYEYKEPENRK